MSEMKQRLGRLLEQVTALGAEADLIASREQSFSLKADQGELSEYKVTGSQQIGIRLIKEGRVGIAYSEALDEPALAAMLQDALDASRFAKEDPDQRISVADSHLETQDSAIVQPDETPVDEKIALALRLEGEMLKREGVKGAPYNAYYESRSELWLANSQGTLCHHSEASVGGYTTALIERDGRQSMFYQGVNERRFSDLAIAPLLDEVYGTALALLDGAPVTTGHYDALLSPNALSALFGCFAAALSGKWAQQGINPWRDKLGQSVASPLLTLESRAHMPGGMRIRAFDGEGAATTDLPLIETGNLNTLLHNSATARHFGVAANGCAARGARSSLDVAPRHLVLGCGPHTDSDVKSGRYLELVKLDGLHSGADAVSGDFSFGASGFLCQDGERIQPVRGITVAGNFYRLLKEVLAVGQHLRHDDGKGFYAPLIRFAGLSVAGN
ncbi:TldD/PmbA family protein [Aeromonas simiae]|uniref:TldD/PmbA family protein n=1 Tax=Aeromonas simiae TaxID=218936 RepID=UPI0005A72F4A|nr:TldD/PmbA family protein [Aeromonas simiae]MDO2949108.1 TldD/PmbA family protein [Aeromonas simiae]MDO2953950.1 TldD/PmbA family protein [Aeromonas simiae]MDO2956297.1 TldD/PmbA family protein [Aeromonas simiae]